MLNVLLRKLAKKQVSEANNDKRPIKFVPDGENSWRIVWADGRN